MHTHSITHPGRWTTTIKLGLLLVTAAALALSAPGTTHAASFTVNSTADTDDGSCDPPPRPGDCTLREAIHEANASPGTDTITFNIPGAGVKTIKPLSPLPAFTGPVILDGYTQPGASPNTLSIGSDAVLRIELSGNPNMHGIVLDANASTLRGLVINGFDAGIVVNGDKNKVEGNFIGTDAVGTGDEGNESYGVWVKGNANTIGGTTPAARNVLSGNDSSGLVIYYLEHTPTANIVQGNYIGTDKNGTAPLGNYYYGIHIDGSNNTLIGGTQAGARNVISGNEEDGIIISGSQAPAGTLIQGNYIGVDAYGTAALGNQADGVFLGATVLNTLIGGTTRGAGNVIAHDNGNGIGIEKPGIGNAIRRNRIFDNKGIFEFNRQGIDLDYDDVTPNDAGDADSGANNLQNFPVINQALTATNSIVGTLKSKPDTPYAIEFFSSTSCDPSGYGEGEKYLGTTTVITSGVGKATFNVVVKKKFKLGESITGTATDPNGNTSEFSKCKAVAPQG